MKFRHWISAPTSRNLIGMGLVGMFALPSLGCDTVALISFQERNFADIATSGITPRAGSCEGSDGKTTMRFVLIGDDDRPIRPGDKIGQELVDLTRDDITLSDGAVFENPDVLCSDNSDCLSSDFTCSLANEGFDGTLQRCQRASTLALDGAVTFASDVQKNQLFGMVVENSGSLLGWLPRDVGELYPDWNNDGTADGQVDVNLNPDRASDRRNTRGAAFRATRTNWEIVREQANGEGDRRTLFGLWYFAGTSTAAGVTSAIAEVLDGETLWASQPKTIEDALAVVPEPDASRGNVYQGLVKALETGFADPTLSDYEKTLVLFTDGPDELRLETFQIDDVIALANQHSVRVFVVHLDSAVQVEGNPGEFLIRDDPDYWGNQDAPCADDSACRNYETCRTPTGYSSSAGGSVEIGTSDTYCMPARDENGRIGPVDDYARLACETEGGYIYVKFSRSSAGDGGSQAISRRMQWLPLTMDGLWEAEASLDVIENGQVPGDSALKVQSNFSVNVANTQQTYPMSQLGDPSAGRQDDDQDTRLVIFSE